VRAPHAEHLRVKRAIFLGVVAGSLVGSYTVLIFGFASDLAIGPVTNAAVAFTGLSAGLALAAYVTWETRNAHQARDLTESLNAQLVRKEIEIGRLATVDELTGLYTRREFEEVVRLEIARARRHHRPLALLLIEVDDIAELGEHVGSLSKGYLLSEISAVLKRLLRANDSGARYTNDSLAMLLPETGGDQAALVAEKVSSAIAGHQFLGHVQQDAMRVTVSQGAAVLDRTMDGPPDLMKCAENALCEARARGFQQVFVHEAELADDVAGPSPIRPPDDDEPNPYIDLLAS